MIISLRGTSGSGKSTLVRHVTARYERRRDVHEHGRKRPMYSIHGRNPQGRCLVVPGHYEIANGGIDTLHTLEDAYRIARWGALQDHDVLMEGKNMSDGPKHVEALMAEGLDVRVVLLDVPLKRCIASVRERGHNIAEASITKTDAKVRRDFEKFTCTKYKGSREACLAQVKEWLGL